MHTALCRMKESLGESEACPGGGCPFWEDGCVVAQIDLRSRPELARFLLALRQDLEDARAAGCGRAQMNRLSDWR
jgi:hypothetical protein